MQKALVVEGGAMRGIFSAGVLDHFLDNQYQPFDFCIGVSAGSTSLAAWITQQQRRTYTVITDYSCRPEFIDFKRFVRGGHWLDLDWLWDITIKEIPIDIDALHHQTIPFYVVTTNIQSGQAHYIQSTSDNVIELLKASCSVPLAYRDFPVIDGMSMTDGGVADSIPVEQAYKMGAKDITVILSRPLGYQKKPSKAPWLTRKFLAQTPNLAEAALKRAENYNKSIEFIQSPPPDCNITVIAPPADFPVGRLTKDLNKLDMGYEMGISAAKQVLQRHQLAATA
ncbi:patatin-like phospholipase family protein [Vibrio gangliei]|uniref:patatin-like phospholipase family protein n=1 Tax=Vibrio gangliei TaxID=2077090 RepID=UPI000D019782|nr:patatin family protein [Vibrio gangliei]